LNIGLLMNRLNIFILLFLLILLSKPNVINSQNKSLYFNLYTADNGLSQNSINSIVQDKKGFIWIGTQSGLNRFDGYKFKNWFQEPGNLNSLTSGFINQLSIDQQDFIWIGTNTGLNCFDNKTNKFYSFIHLIKSGEISHEHVNCLFVDSENYLWVGTKNGLNRSSYELNKLKPGFTNLRFTKYFAEKSTNSLTNNEIRCIYEDNKGNKWIGTNNGLNCYNKESGKFEHFYFGQYKPSQNGANEINDIEQLNDSIFWVGTEDGLFELNIRSKVIRSFDGLPFFINNKITGNIKALLSDSKGNIWMGTYGDGLLFFSLKEKEFYHFKKNENAKNKLEDNFIISLFEDKSGTLFIGNYMNGLNTTKIYRNYFELFRNTQNDKTSLSENITRHIYCQDENTVWMGTLSKGLENFNPRTKKFTHIPLEELKENKAPVTLQFILPKNKNELWIGTNRAGLLLYNHQTHKYKQYLHIESENSITINDIFWLCADHDSILWIGTFGYGILKMDTKAGKFKNYKLNSDDSSGISEGIITYIKYDSNRNLWLGSWGGGILKFNPATEKIERFKHSTENKNTISSDYVLNIHIDEKGIIWIGTSSGLNKYDPITNKWSYFGKKNGFNDEFINSIEEDKHENLWISTNRGLAKFNKKNYEVNCFDVKDGLLDNEFNSGISTILPDGQMIFGGSNGFNIFHPDSIKPDNFRPKIAITDFQLFYNNIEIGQKYSNKFQLDKSISYMDTIILNYEDNVIGFEFAAFDYKNPENIKYAFRLKGFEENWNYTNHKERFARYTNLDHGEYILQIKSTNSDGNWNDESKNLTIIIEAPFWVTNEFRLILTIIFAILVILVYRLRLSMLNTQKRKLEEQVTERTIEISDKNLELKEKYEEIVAQEEEIREQAEELQVLSEKLTESNQSLSIKVKERTIELEAALFKAEDSQKLISSFLSNLSHEIRTPLNAILGFTQLIGIGNLTESLKNQYANIIEQNVDSLLTQIGNIMDVAKLNTGQYQLKNASFHLSDLLEELYTEMEPLSKTDTKNIELKLTNNNNGLAIHTDRNAIKNILKNLIENAIKYTEKGNVEFGYNIATSSFDKSKAYIISNKSDIVLDIFVSDTGIGISEDEQLKIFNAFTKIEDTRKKLYRGTGIGLTLVKNLTEKLNGQIKLESKLNEGSKFLISFRIGEI